MEVPSLPGSRVLISEPDPVHYQVPLAPGQCVTVIWIMNIRLLLKHNPFAILVKSSCSFRCFPLLPAGQGLLSAAVNVLLCSSASPCPIFDKRSLPVSSVLSRHVCPLWFVWQTMRWPPLHTGNTALSAKRRAVEVLFSSLVSLCVRPWASTAVMSDGAAFFMTWWLDLSSDNPENGT